MDAVIVSGMCPERETQIEDTSKPVVVGDDLRQIQEEFVMHTSFEMRSLLNAITGFSDLLRDGVIIPEHKDYSEEIYNASRKLVGFVDDMVEYADLCANSVIVKPCELILADVIEDIKLRLRAKAAETQKKLMLVLAGDIGGNVTSDGDILSRSLMHLAEAFFCGICGDLIELKIFVRRNCSCPCVVFDFHSPLCESIDMENYKSQLSFSEDRDVNMDVIVGNVKLAISRALAGLVAAEVEIRRTPGGECVYSLVVPIMERKIPREMVDEDIETTVIQSKSVSRQDFPEDILCTGRILLVDDDEQCQRVIALLLGCMGLEVVTACDGDDAIKKARGDYFDLIFMDVWMPGINGCQAVMQMREDGVTVPVFALTADASDSTVSKCMASGFDGVISKPVDKKRLYGVISNYLPVSAIDLD